MKKTIQADACSDAGKGVTGPGKDDQLCIHVYGFPPLPFDGSADIGHLAEVFHASGYFGDLTPAQIAVHIIAGRSLGMDPAQAVFDLEVTPGPNVKHKAMRDYEGIRDFLRAKEVGDMVRPRGRAEPVKLDNVFDIGEGGQAGRACQGNGFTCPNEVTGPGVLCDDCLKIHAETAIFTAPSDGIITKDGGAFKFVPDDGGPEITLEQAFKDPEPADDIATPETASAAGKCPTCESPKPNLHPAMQFEGEVQPCTDVWHLQATNATPVPASLSIVIIEHPDGTKFDVTEINTDLANSGPTIVPNPEKALTPAPDAETASEAAKRKKDDIVSSGQYVDTGNLDAEHVPIWRTVIENLMLDVGHSEHMVRQKLEKFDGLDLPGQHELLRSTQTWHQTKVHRIATAVKNALCADGKTSRETQAGFFLYAAVPDTPHAWTYRQAIIAQNKIEEFLSSKRKTRPPAA